MSSKYITQVVVAATDIDLELGFQPKRVAVRNLTNGLKLEWVEGMRASTGILTAANGDVTVNKPTLTWDRATTDLVFTNVSAGPEFVSVVVVDAGAGATVPAVVITGTGAEADPYLYTFTIYDDTNANDDFIALLSADLYLRASGAQAADESAADSLALTAIAATLGIAIRGLADTDEQSKGLGLVLGQTVGINATADAGDVLSIEADRGDQLL